MELASCDLKQNAPHRKPPAARGWVSISCRFLHLLVGKPQNQGGVRSKIAQSACLTTDFSVGNVKIESLNEIPLSRKSSPLANSALHSRFS